MTKGYSELALVEAGLQDSLSPSIYEQIGLGGRTKDQSDNFFSMEEVLDAEDGEKETVNNPFYHTYKIDPLFKKGKPKASERPKKPEVSEDAKKIEKKPRWTRKGDRKSVV